MNIAKQAGGGMTKRKCHAVVLS